MQDVENNMDDLFRSAAENYKPNPGKSGWNVVQPQLLNQSIASANPVEKRKKNKVLLLLLLLPFAAGMLTYYFVFDTAQKSTAAVKHSTKGKLPKKQNNSISIGETTIKPVAKIIAEQKNITSFKLNSVVVNADINNNYYTSTQIIPGSNIKTEYANTELPVLINDVFESSIKQKEEKIIVLPDTAITKNNVATSTAKNAIVTTGKKKFYYGLSLGPSLNQVKNQGFKKPGYNFGVVAGYTLTKNFSLETGLLYSKKYYSSDGKYFNMEKMPAGMKVLSLTGSCNVFEIPVNLKYNIAHKNTSAVFASAGVSSSILTRERNNYIASINNAAPQKLNGLYKNVSTGLVSSANLGIGYEHNIGKQNSIRIQPYMQIPLKGMGVGKMQVMSAGINIAITRPFH